MREYLEEGGEAAVLSLIGWLEDGAKEEGFAAGDPSPQDVIKSSCVECHHSDGGDMEDVPFAANDEAEPEYTLVVEVAEPEFERHEQGPQGMRGRLAGLRVSAQTQILLPLLHHLRSRPSSLLTSQSPPSPAIFGRSLKV